MDVKPVVNVPSTEAAIIEATSKSSGTTHVKLSHFQYTWTLTNFSFCKKKTGQSLTSPFFFTGTKNKAKWMLRMFPNNLNNKKQDYLSIYLEFVADNDNPEVDVKCKISIFNADNKKAVSHEFMDIKKCSNDCLSWGWPKFVLNNVLHDVANGLLRNDSLTIVCNMTIVDEVVNSLSDFQAVKIPECQLLDNFQYLFVSTELSDITIVGYDREFRAHRSILAARSPVFSAMFRNKHLYTIYMHRVKGDVLNDMLCYIYTGKTWNLKEIAEDLLPVADKYKLTRLKALCENSLCQSLEIKNAVRRLIVGELYGAIRLKAQTLKFVSKNIMEVMKTADYIDMRYTHPNLMGEILELWSTKIAESVASAAAVSDSSQFVCKKRKI